MKSKLSCKIKLKDHAYEKIHKIESYIFNQ